ncbi:hypothetical protein HAX54_049048 [Datura stramonium]|uniref:Uncharacterized protein n=1 Tax=Datura stramonium TaxID=4076 RepID=A0ABS8WK34_DATST|nr:hypothetical protein [Datura stramonium]
MIGNLEEAPDTEYVILSVVTGLAEKESFDLSREHLFEENLSEKRSPSLHCPLPSGMGLQFHPSLLPLPPQLLKMMRFPLTLCSTQNLVRPPSPPLSQRRDTKTEPVTHGKVKRSMEEILQDNHQNTLKRHRFLRTMVFEDEVPSSQLVKRDAEDTSQIVEESLVVGKESHRSKKAGSICLIFMHENEVTELYASLLYTDDEETVFATMGGVQFSFNSISLGKILNVPTQRIFTVKDKHTSPDLLKLIEKLERNLKSDRMFKKQLKPEHQ